jgi:hypothetical protein
MNVAMRKERYCEQEPVVTAALRSSTLNADLLAHAAGCDCCSDVLLVSEFLREESASLDHELRTPDAASIWRKAQARAREKAFARATLPIRVARNCAYILVILAAPWIAFEFSRQPAWLPDLGLKHLPLIDGSWMDGNWINGNWLAALTGTTLVGIAAVTVCVALSSWYVLRAE